ncbi:MAG: quinolinate synthase NadA [Clostridia bacterium]|nr:quinolinate synthase NadA [Clostridia bacterium]
MNTSEIQKEILRLKSEKNCCILAHSYQSGEILEVADFTDDSFALSTAANRIDCGTVILCGVRFMAETVKILSPEKHVILANPSAGCPMADSIDAEKVRELKRQYPGYAVVAYINTTAEVKAECDVCVTSSSAVRIMDNLDSDGIIFIPDINLGRYVKNRFGEKDIILYDGCCPRHACISADTVRSVMKLHPDARFLVHPECGEDVVDLAHFVGSTKEIMDEAASGNAGEYIIGTEISIVQHLSRACPDKKFYPVSNDLVCGDMRITSLSDILGALNGTGGEEIYIRQEILDKARGSIDRMIELGR